MPFTLNIDPKAIRDVQQAIDYYEELQAGLGKRFEIELNKYLLTLTKNPFFRIRYDNVRCLPLRKFPFMVHFTVDEIHLTVSVRAVLSTVLDPKKWKETK